VRTAPALSGRQERRPLRRAYAKWRYGGRWGGGGGAARIIPVIPESVM